MGRKVGEAQWLAARQVSEGAPPTRARVAAMLGLDMSHVYHRAAAEGWRTIDFRNQAIRGLYDEVRLLAAALGADAGGAGEPPPLAPPHKGEGDAGGGGFGPRRSDSQDIGFASAGQTAPQPHEREEDGGGGEPPPLTAFGLRRSESQEVGFASAGQTASQPHTGEGDGGAGAPPPLTPPHKGEGDSGGGDGLAWERMEPVELLAHAGAFVARQVGRLIGHADRRGGRLDKAQVEGLAALARMMDRWEALAAARARDDKTKSDDELAKILAAIDDRIAELAAGEVERLLRRPRAGRPRGRPRRGVDRDGPPRADAAVAP